MKLNWDLALQTADEALSYTKKDPRIMIVKGEALFNVCQFEHALVFFSRGLVRTHYESMIYKHFACISRTLKLYLCKYQPWTSI